MARAGTPQGYRPLAFAGYHPAVVLLWLALVLVCCMVAQQPVCAALSFAGASVLATWLRGMRGWAAQLPAYIAIVVVLALINPLINPLGQTVLARPFGITCTLEALVWGAVSGTMLASVFCWFGSWSLVLPNDRVMALFGRVAPTVSLMLSMTLSLVPRLVARTREVLAARRTLVHVAGGGKAQAARDAAQTSATLMGWGMEDALARADAMKARGYGSRRLTVYEDHRWTRRDMAALAAVALLGAASLFLVGTAAPQFQFYPALTRLRLWWGYAVYALFLTLPFVVEGVEAIRWTLSR